MGEFLKNGINILLHYKTFIQYDTKVFILLGHLY